MKDTPCTAMCSFLQCTYNLIRPVLRSGAGTAALLLTTLAASAGSYVVDFNSGLPAGATVYGSATVAPSDGVTNSGCLKLTTAANTLQGSFVITNDLDAGANVLGLVARFQAYVGGGSGADGFSFNFAPDLPANGNFAEEGAGTGLTVSFDTYSNDFDTVGIELKGSGGAAASWSAINLRAGTWVDVLIQLHPDGNVDVMYDGNWVFTNQWSGVALPITGGHIGFGARTGGANDNHWIDNLSLTTFVDTKAAAYVDYYYPTGRRVRADAPIYVELSDYFNYYTSVNSQVNPSSIVLQVDGTTVSPILTRSGSKTAIAYQPPAIFPSASTHTVTLSFADDVTPTPNHTTWVWSFTTGSYGLLDTNLIAPSAFVSATPGFALRFSQIEPHFGNTILRAENQLANLLVDASGQPYPNIATPIQGGYAYNEIKVLNYAANPDRGNFMGDAPIPGLPGTTGGTTNYAMDVVTYLYFTPGLYTLGVNSSDGFRLTAASTPDYFAPEEMSFNGVRDAADSTLTFGVAQAGYYPFRICYFVGGVEQVNPTTNNPCLEFFSVAADGERTLVNGTNAAGTMVVPARQPAQTLPYIRSISPNDGGVTRSASIEVSLVNGTITVQNDSINLWLNGAAITPTITTSGGVTTVYYQPSAPFAMGSTNTVEFAFTDSNATRRTNSWKFVTENVLTQLWKINAGTYNWMTTGGTERGLAYNPKTGHVLLVSRGVPSGLQLCILDGNTGAFLGTLNTNLVDGTYITGGTYRANMIDVAEDGVIYMGNLAVNANEPFKIYRWADESAAPTLAFSGNPTAPAGTPRWGDDFRIRGSGAGTQIIASGNNTGGNSVPLFTTIDGTNFTVTVMTVSGMANNALRLGLAFGCGNTFYGDTTASALVYGQFAGAGSTAAAQITNYWLRSGSGTTNVAAIGVDLINQRLIGNGTGQTTQPHTMNLYDLTALVTTNSNAPLDYKTFDSQNGTFGTGSVDFTPDGTRVYTLDTANGIIAFSLNPKLAAPVICAQPQTNLLGGIGAVGFMDVTAIGAPQSYQWRFNGANLTGATNRTLDIYNVQQSQLGLYSVVITNPLGSVTSSVAVLDTQMAITSQPASQQVNPGTTAILTVGISNGLAPYAYQWALNGTNLPNGTASTLPLNNAQVTDAGTYTVSITDSLGQVITSQPAVFIVAPLGTGTGLAADYYDVLDYSTATPPNPFSGYPLVSRVDPTVDFDWGTTGSPDMGYITMDYFTARWHGQVQPFYSQAHTFYTRTDDGVRLWVNGQLLIDQWVAQAPTEKSGTIALNAGQKYDILMEYFEKTGGAVAQLSWSSPSLPKAIIPKTQLYPGSGAFRPGLTTSLVNGTNVILNWMGTCTVESATNVAGPWTPVATDIAGPYTNSVGSEPQMYFRLLSQQTL